ncbi:hypothetical protein [Streptomyces sp. NPDC089799]|uniref:COG1470 family protein n=1 Tax=Streptomyces sp. NPDC089799 TaxID=3155066 RepID=UPI0034307C98
MHAPHRRRHPAPRHRHPARPRLCRGPLRAAAAPPAAALAAAFLLAAAATAAPAASAADSGARGQVSARTAAAPRATVPRTATAANAAASARTTSAPRTVAPPAASAADPGWTAEPATASPSAVPRPFFYLQGPAGSVLEDRLALANPTDREHVITLRGADAYNTADGAFAVRPPGASTASGPWISFGTHGTVRIPPRHRAVVPFTVTLPADAVPGDHPVAVVAEEAGREAGVRVHLRVSGPALAALTVEDVSVAGRGTAARVRYALVNRGNVALSPEAVLRTDGLFGGPEERPAHRLPVELLPGQRVELTEPWPGAPRLDAVDLTLTVTAPGGARATGTASARMVPWSAAGWTGAGLIALAGAVLAARRTVRSRQRDPGPSAAPPAAPSVREPELTGASK